MQNTSMSLRVKQFIAVALLLGIAGGVTTGIAGLGEKEINLRGTFHIGGKTIIDPPPNEPKRTHAYFAIEGDAALQMYRAMKAAESEDCVNEGERAKRAGPLQCWISANRKDAHCDFSVDLVNGRLGAGSVC